MTNKYDTVTGLNIFPIKSAQAATLDGNPPERLSVGATGFVAHGVRDRDFIVVESEPVRGGSHLFVSQRGWDANEKAVYKTDSTLARLAVNITARYLELHHPDTGDFGLPTGYETGGLRYPVRVHSGVLQCAIDQGGGVAKYLSNVLDRPVRLARTSRVYPRFVPEEYWHPNASNQTGGSDGFPFLLVSQSSLNQSNIQHHLSGNDAVPISAYRGNVEIDGEVAGPYGEDNYRHICIGCISAYVVKACTRCPIPTIDQQTGQLNAIPALKILRNHRGKVTPGGSAQPLFGQNLNHVYEDGLSIGLGDRITVLASAGVRNFFEA